MSKALDKLLKKEIRVELDKNNIGIEPPYCIQYFYCNGFQYELKISYTKPSSSLRSQRKFLSKLLYKFDSYYNEIERITDECIKHFPLLEEDDIHYGIHRVVSQQQTHQHWYDKNDNLIKNFLSKKSIKKETKLLTELEDYPEVFPKARRKKRKIKAFLGDTNSGKTWSAMSEIANSTNAAYMAPLRLLALETFEYLNDQGITTSLVTGEEKAIKPDAWCTSSTVECFNPDINYDLIVIDEIQMIDDIDRGAFFIQALVGANANNIIVTGPKEYKEKLKALADYLGDDFELELFTRKSELKPLKNYTSLENVKPNTAIIAFSRKDIYQIKKALPSHVKSTVLYGALGHDVRKTQAQRLINGEVDVIITTDCIGMGLNLPIETILFSSDRKFNGRCVEEISDMLCKQIAGRAGRYGQFDIGYYGATDKNILGNIKEKVSNRLMPENRFNYRVLPPKDYVNKLLDIYTLSSILESWAHDHKFVSDSIFETDSLKRPISIAKYLEDKFTNSVYYFWQLIYCPIDIDKEYAEFHHTCKQLINDGFIELPTNNPEMIGQNALERYLKELTMLLWFAHNYPEYMDESAIEDIKIKIENVNIELNKILMKK